MAACDPNAKKKYNYMEPSIQYLLKNHITLNDEHVKMNNKILLAIVDTLIARIKEISPLFKMLYQERFSGGSFYDGLKIGKPDEYDLDLKLVFPKKLLDKVKVVPVQASPAYVRFQILDKNLDADLAKLMHGNFLSAQATSQWMESLVTKALNYLPQKGAFRMITLNNPTKDVLLLKMHKSGPAMTLKITGTVNRTAFHMDVDMVACFECGSNLWSGNKYRSSVVDNKGNFLIVPKMPSANISNDIPATDCWRLSLQEQERILISKYARLKPAVKLIKLLRDKFQQKMISSYFIKTVFLWEIEKHKNDESFWRNSQSYVLMEMFKVFAQYLQSGNIPYYWNKNFNLIGKINKKTLAGYSNRWTNMLRQIDLKLNQPILINYYLDGAELMKYNNITQNLKNDAPFVNFQ